MPYPFHRYIHYLHSTVIYTTSIPPLYTLPPFHRYMPYPFHRHMPYPFHRYIHYLHSTVIYTTSIPPLYTLPPFHRYMPYPFHRYMPHPFHRYMPYPFHRYIHYLHFTVICPISPHYIHHMPYSNLHFFMDTTINNIIFIIFNIVIIRVKINHCLTNNFFNVTVAVAVTNLFNGNNIYFQGCI